jgi:hypothetical protein
MAEKAKRTVLTPEQRVAKLEAELEAAKNKAAERNQKKADVLLDRRSKISARAADLDAQLMVIDAELIDLGFAAKVAEVSGIEDEPTISTDVGQFT